MKKIVLLLAVVAGIVTTSGQESCEELANVCKKYLEPKKESKGVFISDGQVYRAFVDAGQEAEFHATLYGGSTYRVAASAGSKDGYVIFEIRDMQGNVLFTNNEHTNKNEPYWDFNVQSTLDVRIILKMDENKKDSGCITMLIGFKQ